MKIASYTLKETVPAHTIALTDDGRVFLWGTRWDCVGANAQSCSGGGKGVDEPVLVQGLPDDITRVYAGPSILAAIDGEGNLWIWGNDKEGNVTGTTGGAVVSEPTKFIYQDKVTCFKDVQTQGAGLATFALGCDGNLYMWGERIGFSDGSGNGEQYDDMEPRMMTLGAPIVDFSVAANTDDDTIDLSFGGLAITEDHAGKRRLYAWGKNGFANGNDAATPQEVDLAEGVVPESVASAEAAFMIDSLGRAYSWGKSYKTIGQENPGHVNDPLQLPNIDQPIVQIVTRGETVIALAENHKIWSWGVGFYGISGGAKPRLNESEAEVSSVSLGVEGMAALGMDGQVHVSGVNTAGYLQPGSDEDAPVQGKVDYQWGTHTLFSEFSSNLPLTHSTLNDLTSADVYGVGVTAEVKRNKTDENGNPVLDGEGKPVVETVRTYDPLLLKGEEAQVGAGSSPVMQLVAREYDLGTLQPGDWVEAHFSGKVNRPGLGADPAGLVVGNQAWFTSKETPRQQPTLSETPALPTFDNQNPFAYGKWGKDNPQGDPDGSLWDKCSATKDWELPGDQCDMVFASIPGHDQPVGHLSGNVWKADADRPDYQAQNDELLSDVRVELHRGDPGAEVDAPRTTFTDENGHYEFKNLPVGDDYRVFVDRVSIPTQAGNSLRFVEPHWGQNPQGSAPKSDNSFAYDSYVTTWIPGDTPMVSVEANKWRDHVNAGLFETKAAISVVKQGQDLDEQWKNHIGAGYDTAYPIRATITNTGEEPIDHLVFTDETGPVSKGQVDVKWEKCVFPDYNGASQEEYSFKDPNSLPVAFAPGITLDVGASFQCFGEMPGMPVDAEDHLDTVTVTGVSTKSGTDVRDDDDFTASLDPDSIPEPKIHLEKGILVDALTDEDGHLVVGEDGKPVCPNGSVRHRYDDSCWIKETALVPGGSIELTFRVTNVGDEDLLDLDVVDEVLEGDATLSEITCEWTTKETANGVRRWLPSRDTMTTETPNWVDCQAQLTFAEGSLAEHLNQAWASGVGAISGKHTNDDSDFKAVAVLSTPFLLEKLGDGGATDRLVGSQWGLFDLEGVPVEDVEPLLCADEADASDAVGDPAQDACLKAIMAEKAERGEWKPDLFVIAGLPAGKYLLGEVKAPEGYNLLAEAIEIVVSPDGTVALGEGSQSSATVGAHESEMQIVSVSDSLSIGGLPLTGQSGPWMWLVVGTLIVSVSWFYMNRGARAFRRAR